MWGNSGTGCNTSTNGGTQLTCLDDDTCTFVYVNGSSNIKVVRSEDDGMTWTQVLGTGSTGVSVYSLTVDSIGGSSPPNASVGTQIGVFAIGSVWSASSAWSISSSCWGSFVMNNVAYGVCYSGSGSVYHIRRISTGALVQSPTLPGALALTSNGGLSYSPSNNIIYTLVSWQPPSGNAPIGIYVSKNGGSTYALLTTVPVSVSMREGDIWKHPINGCLYFSAGNTPMIGKVC
jgi:hypothetical protein